MAHPSRSGRKQKAVYWAFSGYDNNGDPKVSSPVEIDVRWIKGRSKNQADDETPIPEEATVKVFSAVAEGSIIWLGRLANLPSPVTNVMQVVSFDDTPDVKGRRSERIVRLQKYRNTNLPTVE